MGETIMDSITNAVYEAISDVAYGELVHVAADLAKERFAADRASA